MGGRRTVSKGAQGGRGHGPVPPLPTPLPPGVGARGPLKGKKKMYFVSPIGTSVWRLKYVPIHNLSGVQVDLALGTANEQRTGHYIGSRGPSVAKVAGPHLI